MSDSIESPEDPPESLKSESIEKPESIDSEPIEEPDFIKTENAENADAYDLETVELPEIFATDQPKSFDNNFGPNPIDMICTQCGCTMRTRITKEFTTFGDIDSTSCFFACLNICFGGIELTRHHCSECDAIVGTYSPPTENTDNYRSGSPNGFITNNNDVDQIITQEEKRIQNECETTPNNDNECLEIEDCVDENDNWDGGDCDAGGDGGDGGGGAD